MLFIYETNFSKNIIKKGKYHLPIITTETKFTDKYKKMLSHYFERNKISNVN